MSRTKPDTAVLNAAEHLAALPRGAGWEWIKHAAMRMLCNLVSARRGMPMPWPRPQWAAVLLGELDTAAQTLAGLDTKGWGMPQVAGLYEVLLEHDLVDGRPVRNPDPQRRARGSWYTPPALAAHMCRLSLAAGLRESDQANPGAGPEAVLAVRAHDPACGAGVFLTEALEWLAGEYVRRGGDARDAPVLVVAHCIRGQDIDPVAVDLARTALWWHLGGRLPLDALAGAVTVADTLQERTAA